MKTRKIRGEISDSLQKKVPAVILKMSPQRNDPSKFVVCVDNTGYPASLELYKIYRVLPDIGAEKDGDLRVIDEIGEDYLFSAHRFVFVNLPDEVTTRFQTTPA